MNIEIRIFTFFKVKTVKTQLSSNFCDVRLIDLNRLFILCGKYMQQKLSLFSLFFLIKYFKDFNRLQIMLHMIMLYILTSDCKLN